VAVWARPLPFDLRYGPDIADGLSAKSPEGQPAPQTPRAPFGHMRPPRSIGSRGAAIGQQGWRRASEGRQSLSSVQAGLLFQPPPPASSVATISKVPLKPLLLMTKNDREPSIAGRAVWSF
jgi:hypothetical protein